LFPNDTSCTEFFFVAAWEEIIEMMIIIIDRELNFSIFLAMLNMNNNTIEIYTRIWHPSRQQINIKKICWNNFIIICRDIDKSQKKMISCTTIYLNTLILIVSQNFFFSMITALWNNFFVSSLTWGISITDTNWIMLNFF